MWPFNLKRPQKNIPTVSKRFLREISVQQETLALRSHFKEILKTLREHNLEKLPWYLVLGPEKSGKTTLLSQPFYHWNYIIPPFFAARSLKDTPSTTSLLHPICARINQDAVFIEIPGRYLQEKTSKNSVFGTFLNLVKKNKISGLIQGIILVLGLDEVTKLSAQKHQEQIYTLKQCLLETAEILKRPINLQILLTKTDTLTGFNEFFSEALQEERLDVFGIELPVQVFNRSIPPSQAVSDQFNLLLKKLNERIIWLLHRERLIDKKALIADFPQQLASFKELLNQYVYHLFDIAPYQTKIFLRSIYFCSSTHHGETVDHLSKFLSIYNLPERTNITTSLKPKNYFVSRLLRTITNTPKAYKFSPQEIFAIPRHITLMAAFLLVLIAITYLSSDFYQKNRIINDLQKEFKINSHLNFSGDSSQALLNELLILGSLQKIIQLQQTIPFSFLINLKLHPLHSFLSQAKQNHQQILQNQFIPLLKSTLTRELLNASLANPNSVYPTLKAYLALSNPQKNSAYLTAWLKNYLGSENLKTSQMKLNRQCIDFNLCPPIQLDNPAIFHAQSVLNNLPKPFLAYLILKGEMITTMDPFPADFDKVFVYLSNTREIPTIYTYEKIASIYFEKIPAFTKAAFSGNEVLGRQFFTEVNATELNNVIEQVRAFYFQDYAKHWLQILTHTEIKLATNFQQAVVILDTLSKKSSPLSLLLQEVTKQITFDIPALSQKRSLVEQQNFYSHVKNHLMIDDATSRVLTARPQLVNDTIQHESLRLKKILESISKSSDVKKAAFEMTKLEYQNQKTFGKLAKIAFEMPQPLSRWLISLISNDWLILLQTTRTYTNQMWQSMVLPEYRSKLGERYPLVRQSTIDVQLADFAHFFGKSGTLDSFFNQYLSHFIDTNKAYWQWRELYGQSLSNNKSLPLQIERATLIRKMFFSKTDELAVEFYLIPMTMTPTLKGIELTIDGQQVNTQTQNLTSTPLIWPGVKNNDGSNLTFLKQTGEQVLLAEKGPWSLFRLLDNAYIQPIKDSKHYLVTFDLNGNAAKYQLMTEQAINPFIPNFISQFSCLEEF